MKIASTIILTTLLYGSAFAQPGTFDPNFAMGSVQNLRPYSSNFIADMPNHKILSSGNESAFTILNNGTQQNPSLQFQNTYSDGVLGSIANTAGNLLTISNLHTLSFPTNFQFDEITDIGKNSSGKIAITGFRRAIYTDVSLSAFVGLVDPTTGNLESSFNSGDYVILSSTGTYLSQQLEVQSDDKIIIAGYESGNNFFVKRFNADGSIDVNFGGMNGSNYFTAYDASSMQISDMKVMSDGKIIVAGSDMENSKLRGFVVRFNADGSFDNSFGLNGFVSIDFEVGNVHNRVTSVDVNSSGEIIVVGTIIGSSTSGAMLKLTNTGAIATNFSLYEEGNLNFNKVKVLSSGKILAAGASLITGKDNALFMLFNSDGTTDNTFGNTNDGKATFSGGLPYGLVVFDFDVQPDGKVIFVARSTGAYQTAVYSGRMLMSNSSTGLDKVELKTLNIQPNPTNGIMNVSIANPTSAIITSANGTILSTLELNGETTIDVSNYSPGVYFIRTAEGETVKFIKE